MINLKLPSRRGFTLIEAMVSMVIVAFMLAAALNTAGAARVRQAANETRARATWLAQVTMTEILEKPYTDPGGLSILGLDLGESQADRSTLDDVDDYDGLSETPPKTSDGVTMLDYSGWTRTVAVTNVQAADFGTTALFDTNFKRITVTVKKGRTTMATLTALRTKARDSW